jgi:glucan phosphoethanolaminetransferase (alkaline phosphatase superfamily)
MITRATANDFNVSLKEKSLVTLFKEAGFSTHWICNQEIFKGYGADKYLEEIDNFHYTCGSGNDEVVLPVLKGILDNDSSNKQFIVLNLFGNHYGVDSHPDEYNFFSPNLENSKVGSRSIESRELFINSYDNSVLYQDFVISKVIQLIQAKEAVSFVFFSSDHGESLFDEPDFFYGHGSAKPTKEQVHVPAFVWYSSLYKKYNDNVVSNLHQNKNKKLSSDNLFYTVSNLGLLSYPLYADSMSIADSNFLEPDTRFAIIDRTPVPVSFD